LHIGIRAAGIILDSDSGKGRSKRIGKTANVLMAALFSSWEQYYSKNDERIDDYAGKGHVYP